MQHNAIVHFVNIQRWIIQQLGACSAVQKPVLNVKWLILIRQCAALVAQSLHRAHH